MKTDPAKKDKWTQIISTIKASNLPAMKYCKENSLSYPQYKYWEGVLDVKPSVASRKTMPSSVSQFVPVSLESAPEKILPELPELFLRVGGFEVLIRRS